MKNEYGKKKFNKRIFIVTDGESNCDNNYNNNIKELIELIKDSDIKINIIALEFFNELDLEEEGEVIEEISNEDNSEHTYISIDKFKLQGDIKELSNYQKYNKKSFSKNQLRTKIAITNLLEDCPDQIKVFTAKQASQIQNQFRKKKVNPVVKYKGPLKITPNLSLDVNVYVKSSEVRMPSLQKYSLASNFISDVNSNMIENEKIFYVYDDADQIPVPLNKISKAYYYGKSIVPFSNDDFSNVKCLEEKSLKAIGFTEMYKVPSNKIIK